uniref:ATP synthase subunit s, mitochondrial n=1 Tax=Elaeophora elaphi TaxID=1147741 RepID=A0A0R3S0Y7_9BILA
MVEFVALSCRSIFGVTTSLWSLKPFATQILSIKNLHVIMSDGTSITCRADMRRYISNFGFNFRTIPVPATPFKWSPVLPTVSMKKLDAIYEMRWAKKPNIYIVKVDATDSAISDAGFQYFKECRKVEVLKMNFCDFFTDVAIEHLVSGRPSRTLRNIEIVANPYISDNFIKGINRIRGLQRAHFYFLPCVAEQANAVRSLKASLPCCRVSFPELKEVGYGYGCTIEESNASYPKLIHEITEHKLLFLLANFMLFSVSIKPKPLSLPFLQDFKN